MTEEKKARLVAAGTAMSVIVLVVLLTIMIFQLVTMSAKNREIRELQNQMRQLEAEIEKGNEDADLWLQEWKIKERARQIGYEFKGKNDD